MQQDLHNRQEKSFSQSGRSRGLHNGDLAQQMIALQRRINARNFAVFRVTGTGFSAKRQIKIVADNFLPSGPGAAAILETYGDALLNNLDVSSNPMLWNGIDEANTAETVDFNAFVIRLRGRSLPFSGIVFPVRLGASANGYAVFTASYLDLNSEIIIQLHLQATAALANMLQQEERNGRPAELLTEREIACLQMAGDGHISEEIAEKLGLSVHTVNAYLGTATTKLDSVNRIQAIAKAIRLGYIN